MGFLNDLFGVTGAKNAVSNAAAQNRQVGNDAYARAESLQQPYIQGGQQAYGTLGDILGLNGNPAQAAYFQNYQTSPDVKFRVQRGVDAIDNSSAARTGGVLSGGLLKRLQEFGTGVATQDLNNRIGQIAGVANSGQTAANTLTNANYQTAGILSNANNAEGTGLANASLAGGSILGNLIGGAMGLAGNLGFNPFGGAKSMGGTLGATANRDPWSNIR